MSNPSLAFGALAKPLKGEYALEKKQTRRDRVRDEQKAMQAALVRDRRKCRWFDCAFKALRVEAAHRIHRGMGGNPIGDRSQRHLIVALCVRHHRQWDLGVIDLDPLTHRDFDDLLGFYLRVGDEWIHVASEKRIGVSEARR